MDTKWRLITVVSIIFVLAVDIPYLPNSMTEHNASYWSGLRGYGVRGHIVPNFVKSRFDIPNLKGNRAYYFKEGDITFGFLLPLTERVMWKEDSADVCSGDQLPFAWQMTEAVVFAVNYINSQADLLPNVKLGFAIVNYCFDASVALETSMVFIPPVNSRSCEGNRSNTSTIACLSGSYSSTAGKQPTYFDVVGVIGPMLSTEAVLVSKLYGLAQIPLLGFITTSDELSDKSEHPYFFRLVPPDSQQVDAMLTFISDNNWSYISVVYMQGSYGEKAFDNIKEKIGKFNVCIATSHRLLSDVNYNEIAQDLVRNSRARVVILFTSHAQVKKIFDAVEKLHRAHHFVWIGGDSWAYNYQDFYPKYNKSIYGAFSFTPYTTYVSSFYKHLENQRLYNTTNPFMKNAWEYITNCSIADGTCNEEENVLLSSRFIHLDILSLLKDAILTFAHAVDDLRRELCPEAEGPMLKTCIRGELLLNFMKNVSFQGFTNHIEFDEFNDVMGKYEIRQIVYGQTQLPYPADQNQTDKENLHGKIIGIYHGITGDIDYKSSIVWSHLKRLARIVPLVNSSIDSGRPESVCSRPCFAREYKIKKEIWCCWECRTCRSNEKILVDNSSCEACPAFTWPEPHTGYTSCAFIHLTYPRVSDSLTIILFCCAFIAILVTLFILACFFKLRNERVIKAASRELTFLQLIAILLGYFTVIEFQFKPSDVICKLTYFLFCLTFALLYCPLLVKTVRIYRIFASANHGNRRPRFVSQWSQIVMSFGLIFVQVGSRQEVT